MTIVQIRVTASSSSSTSSVPTAPSSTRRSSCATGNIFYCFILHLKVKCCIFSAWQWCRGCRWFNVDCSQSEDLYFLNIAVAEENAARQAERWIYLHISTQYVDISTHYLCRYIYTISRYICLAGESEWGSTAETQQCTAVTRNYLTRIPLFSVWTRSSIHTYLHPYPPSNSMRSFA